MGNNRPRNILKGTKYLLANAKIINVGIGHSGVRRGAVGGFYIAVFFSIALDTINWIFDDKYRWTNWLGTVSTDIVKAVIGVIGTVLIDAALAPLSMAIVGIIAGIVVGVSIGIALNYLNNRYHITESIIKALNYVDKEAPVLEDAFYNIHLDAARQVVSFVKLNMGRMEHFYSEVSAKW